MRGEEGWGVSPVFFYNPFPSQTPAGHAPFSHFYSTLDTLISTIDGVLQDNAYIEGGRSPRSATIVHLSEEGDCEISTCRIFFL